MASRLNRELKAKDTCVSGKTLRLQAKADFSAASHYQHCDDSTLILYGRPLPDSGYNSAATSDFGDDVPSPSSTKRNNNTKSTRIDVARVSAALAPAPPMHKPCRCGVTQPGIVVFKRDWSVSYKEKPCACTLERESRRVREEEVVDAATFWGRLKH